MSLKDNFNQAVKEILKRDGLVGDESDREKNKEKEVKKKSELEKYLEPAPRAAEPRSIADIEDDFDSPIGNDSYSASDDDDISSFGRPVVPEPETVITGEQDSYSPPPVSEPKAYEQPSRTYTTNESSASVSQQQSSAYGRTSAASQSGSYSAGAAQSAAASAAQPFGAASSFGSNSSSARSSSPRTPSFSSLQNDTPYYETEETTIISRNTVIDGNIRSFANITIDGSVKGDVKLTKNINVTGKVVGDIECNNSVMSGASMQGSIASKGQVQIDRDSLLLGDITAQYLDLNGKIKGNVDVGGKAEFKTDAIILGNITASTITVLDGATIQGYVNTTFLQESSSSIFPEAIAVSE